MARFAIIKKNVVDNIVAADNKELVELFMPGKTIVEVTEATLPAFIGCGYVGGKFMPPKVYPSWIFDETSWQWKAPKPYPSKVATGKVAIWNEETLVWDIVSLPDVTPPSE